MTTYTGPRTSVHSILYGSKAARSFAAKDKAGRLIGSEVIFLVATATEAPSGYGHAIPPGEVYGFKPGATRDGRPYGAAQQNRWFASAQERSTAIEAYFADAAKRAKKTGLPL